MNTYVAASRPIMFNQQAKDVLLHQSLEKEKIMQRMKKLIIADNLKMLDFSQRDNYGFTQYEKGLFIRDITSEIGRKLGITNLHIMVKYDIEIDAHEHITQSQTIYIKSGGIFDKTNNESYIKGESIFIKSNRIHLLKYLANSEYLVTFNPNLEEENSAD